jgi:hypothetical protein
MAQYAAALQQGLPDPRKSVAQYTGVGHQMPLGLLMVGCPLQSHSVRVSVTLEAALVLQRLFFVPP